MSTRASTGLKTYRRFRATLSVVVLSLVGSVGCSENSPQVHREPDPLSTIELANGTAGIGANERLPTIWLTEKAVILGSRTLAAVDDDQLANSTDREAVERSLVRVKAASGGYGLGIDRRTKFRLVREIMEAGLKTGAGAMELRIGERRNAKAFKVCAAPESAKVHHGADCWGRSVARPDRRRSDGSVGGQSDGDAGADGSIPLGDIESAPQSYQWDAPLELALSIDERYLLVRVQGRPLRTVPLVAPNDDSRRNHLDLLRGTLQSLRRANAWEHRAVLRVSHDIRWETVIGILDVLVEVQFDHVMVLL